MNSSYWVQGRCVWVCVAKRGEKIGHAYNCDNCGIMRWPCVLEEVGRMCAWEGQKVCMCVSELVSQQVC